MASTASYRDVLSHRLTRLLWVAAAVSVLGDFIGAGALLLLAFERAGNQAIGAAGLFAATAAGGIGVAVMGGPLLDRVGRKEGLVGAQLVGAVSLVAPLLIDALWPIYVAAAVIGAVRSTTASLRHGALADSVPDRLRTGLIAMLGANDQFAQVIGYAAGAGVAVAIGAHLALWLDVASFTVGALVLAAAALPGRPAQDDAPPSLGTGWRVIFRHPHLRVVAVMVFTVALTSALPETLAVLAAGDEQAWVPALMAAAPAGTGLGFMIGGRLPTTERFGGQLAHLGLYVGALLLGWLARDPAAWFATNLLVGLGAAWIIGPQVTFVRLAPANRMAQVTATMFALVMAGEGIGTLALGAVADAGGVGLAYTAAAGVAATALLTGVGVLSWRRSTGSTVPTGAGAEPVAATTGSEPPNARTLRSPFRDR